MKKKLPRKKKKQYKKLLLWIEPKAKELGYNTKHGISLGLVIVVAANEMEKKCQTIKKESKVY